MSLSWNTVGDFGSVVDGLQGLTMRRRGEADESPIPAAFRLSMSTKEPEPSGGVAIAADAVWLFEPPETLAPPRVGDFLIDVEATRWTVLEVHRPVADGPLRCVVRNLAVSERLEQHVRIEQAIWEDSGLGPELVGWKTVRPGVPARIQPIEVEVDQQASPTASKSSFRVFLVDEFSLDHRHRLVDARGTAYQIRRYVQPERIDALAVVEVTIDRVSAA